MRILMWIIQWILQFWCFNNNNNEKTVFFNLFYFWFGQHTFSVFSLRLSVFSLFFFGFPNALPKYSHHLWMNLYSSISSISCDAHSGFVFVKSKENLREEKKAISQPTSSEEVFFYTWFELIPNQNLFDGLYFFVYLQTQCMRIAIMYRKEAYQQH